MKIPFIIMPAEEAGKAFVSEFVIGLGFLSGLWIHIGVNPETEILKALTSVLKEINPDPTLGFVFWFMPVIVTIMSWIGAFVIGGWPGFIATVLALIAGIFISSTFGAVLLIIAILLGLVAPNINV